MIPTRTVAVSPASSVPRSQVTGSDSPQLPRSGRAKTRRAGPSGLSPAQIRERFLGDRSPRNDQLIYQRAHDRGEIDLKKIPPVVLAMPFDLVRQDLLLNLEPVGKARLESIVDDLLLPLVGL